MDRITKDDHAICTTEYSRIVPLENGEVSRCIFHPLGLPGFLWLEIIIKKKSWLEDQAFRRVSWKTVGNSSLYSCLGGLWLCLLLLVSFHTYV